MTANIAVAVNINITKEIINIHVIIPLKHRIRSIKINPIKKAIPTEPNIIGQVIEKSLAS